MHIYEKLLTELGITRYALEKKAKLGNGSVGKAIAANSGITLESVEKITRAFPRVRAEFLRTGQGHVLKEEADDQSGDDSSGQVREPALQKVRGFHRNARPAGTPVDLHQTKGGTLFTELSEGYYVMHARRVTVKARAGYLVGWGDSEYIDSLPVHPAIVDEIHKGYYLWFDIDGDSMDDGSKKSIEDGSMALGRQIQRSLWRSKLHYKEYPFYIIVHRTEGIICKQIIDQNVERGVITCHSLNPNKTMYPDFELSLDECHQLFNVVKVERDARR